MYLFQCFQVLWVHSVHEISLCADIVVTFVFHKVHTCVVGGLCNREQHRNTEATQMTRSVSPLTDIVLNNSKNCCLKLHCKLQKDCETFRECLLPSLVPHCSTCHYVTLVFKG